MLPVLAGESPSERQTMFWKRRQKEAARVGDWKWVRNESGEFLFNLADDVGEKNNLIDERPEVAARMRDHFRHWQAEMDAAEPRGPFRDF